MTCLQNSLFLLLSLLPPSLFFPPFLPRLLFLEFQPLLSVNTLAVWVYGYRKEEKFERQSQRRDLQLYNKLLSKHNKPQPDMSCSDRMQAHKDDGDQTGQALYRNKHLPCKQIEREKH